MVELGVFREMHPLRMTDVDRVKATLAQNDKREHIGVSP